MRYTPLCALTAMLIAPLAMAQPRQERDQRDEQVLSLADQAFRAQAWPIALSAYRQALDAGILGADTLCLLIARVYLYKGVHDSALAWNSAPRVSEGTALHHLLLQQRFAIYTLAGWHHEKRLLADTLTLFRRAHRQAQVAAVLIPRLLASLTSGTRYHSEHGALQPYEEDQTSLLEQFGPKLTYGGRLRLAWHLPTSLTRIGLVVNAGASKSYRTNPASSQPGFLDTLLARSEKTGAASLLLENVAGVISFKTELRTFQTYLGGWSNWLNASLYHASTGKLLSRSAGIDYTRRISTSQHQLSGYLFLDPTVLGRYGVVTSLTGSLNFGDPVTYSTAPQTIDFDEHLLQHDIGCRLVSIDRISSATNLTDHGYVLFSLPDPSLGAPAPATQLFVEQPMRYAEVSAEASWRQRITDRFSLELGGGWHTDYYLAATRWTTMTLSPQTFQEHVQADELTLVYERNSGHHFWLNNDDSMTRAFRRHERRRIDHTPSFFVQTEIRTLLGGISFRALVEKTHSTLQRSLPLEIDDLNVRVSTTWFARLQRR